MVLVFLHSALGARLWFSRSSWGSKCATTVASKCVVGNAPAIPKLPDKDELIAPWIKYAGEVMKRYIKLRVDPGTSDGIAAFFAEDSIGSLWKELVHALYSCASIGEERKVQDFVHALYSCGEAGAADSREHLRICTFRQEHLARCVKGLLQFTGAESELPDGLLWFMADGKVHGNANALLKPFTDKANKALPKNKTHLFLATTESSERALRDKTFGVATLGNMQFVYVLSKDKPQVGQKSRIHDASSTNATPNYGPYDRPLRQEIWHVKQGHKGKLYGSALVPAGGKVEGDPGVELDPTPRSTDLVPFTWHGLPVKWYEESKHCYNGVGWIHFTCSDIVLPQLALRDKVPYWGLCHTQEHHDALSKEITNHIFHCLQDPKHWLYEIELVQLLKGDAVGPHSASENTPTKGSGLAAANPSGLEQQGAKSGSAAPKAKSASAGSSGKTLGGGKKSEDLLARLMALDDGEVE